MEQVVSTAIFLDYDDHVLNFRWWWGRRRGGRAPPPQLLKVERSAAVETSKAQNKGIPQAEI